MKTIYSDKIVFENKIAAGYLHMQGDIITDICENYQGTVDADYTGSYIMPGLVNIHSEYIARETALEINRHFPFSKIFRDVETKFLTSGVTTLFHSIELVRGRYRKDFASGPQMVKEIRKLSQDRPLIDHRTHMEFPLSFIDSMEKIKELIEGEYLDYISYLGYLRNEEERYREVYYQEYIQRVMQLDDETVLQMVERVRELRSESNLEELAYMIKYANYKGVKVGSAELNSIRKLGFLQDSGVNIIEFPLNIETIDFAKENGKKVLIDTLHLMKKNKGPHSLDLFLAIEQGKVDILSSDSRTADLMACIFYIAKSIGLPKAVSMATCNASFAVGLFDRGKIESGKRADIIIVEEVAEGTPIVKAAYVGGKLKYRIGW